MFYEKFISIQFPAESLRLVIQDSLKGSLNREDIWKKVTDTESQIAVLARGIFGPPPAELHAKGLVK